MNSESRDSKQNASTWFSIFQGVVLVLSLAANYYLTQTKTKLENEISLLTIEINAQEQLNNISQALLDDNPYKALVNYTSLMEAMKLKGDMRLNNDMQRKNDDRHKVVDVYRRMIINYFKEKVKSLLQAVNPEVQDYAQGCYKLENGLKVPDTDCLISAKKIEPMRDNKGKIIDFISLRHGRPDLTSEEKEIIFIIRAFETVDFIEIGNEFLDDIFYEKESRSYMSPYQVALRHFSKGINLLLRPYNEANVNNAAKHLFYANLVKPNLWNLNELRIAIGAWDVNSNFIPKINNENERKQFVEKLTDELNWKKYITSQQHRIETPKALIDRIQKNNK